MPVYESYVNQIGSDASTHVTNKCLINNFNVEVFDNISKLTNDELRNKTYDFKNRIVENTKEEETEINRLKELITNDPEMVVELKEEHYSTIDNLTKQSYDKTQAFLNDILPEAFSVVQETAKRFAENDTVEVTANQFDRDLSAALDNVTVKGDKAYYKNTWQAGGNTITWDMVHYDVQLIGGTVLHQGKIAEMATGEGKTL